MDPTPRATPPKSTLPDRMVLVPGSSELRAWGWHVGQRVVPGSSTSTTIARAPRVTRPCPTVLWTRLAELYQTLKRQVHLGFNKGLGVFELGLPRVCELFECLSLCAEECHVYMRLCGVRRVAAAAGGGGAWCGATACPHA